jgi:hypothetical protein
VFVEESLERVLYTNKAEAFWLSLTDSEQTPTLPTSPSMLISRQLHGLVYFARKVWAFSGKNTTSAEVFDLETEIWVRLPDLPEIVTKSSISEHNRDIYITGRPSTDVIRFNTGDMTYVKL